MNVVVLREGKYEYVNSCYVICATEDFNHRHVSGRLGSHYELRHILSPQALRHNGAICYVAEEKLTFHTLRYLPNCSKGTVWLRLSSSASLVQSEMLLALLLSLMHSLLGLLDL